MRSSILAAVLFAALLLALAACNSSRVVGLQVDSQLKGFILPRAIVLAGVNLDKIKQTDFFKRHQSQLNLPQLDVLPQQLGMDPRRDLSSLLLAWDGNAAFIMTRGSYAPDPLQKRLSSLTASEKYNQYTLFGDGQRDIVLLPKGVALLGSSLQIKKAINDKAAGTGGVPEGMQLQLTRLNSNAQVWEVSDGIISASQLSLRSDMTSALSNIAGYINASAIGVTFDSGAALNADISCISEEGSQRVNDALRGVIGLARLSTRDDQLDQLRIWDAIKVEKQGKQVHVSANLSPDLADKLVNLLPALAKAR